MSEVDKKSHRTDSDDCLDAPTVPPGSERTAAPTSGADATTPHSDSLVTPSKSKQSPAAGQLPVSGTVIKDYEILDEIARGAMGVVYRAKQHSLNRLVAIKVMLADAEDGEESRKRFEIEARAAAALEHPGIVPVYEVGSWNDFPFFVMGLVEGRSLADELRDHPLPNRRAAEIAREVADAIAHAHQQQIIHRDLKPANILIDETGSAHVTDFGVSKFLGSGSDLTSCGELIGTPHFMPPEQAGSATAGSIGPTADVYSIGAVLFASLTGRPPFQAASPLEVVSQVITKEPVAPSDLNASVPVELDVIALKCLRKDPKERYVSAEALANDLARYLRGEPIEARPLSFVQQARLQFRRHVLLTSISGSVAMLMLVLTFVVFTALLRTRAREARLAEQLEVTENQLAVERMAFKRFLRPASGENRARQFVDFEIDRLAAAAKSQAELQPDLATQLAIESLQLANANRVSPPDAAVSVLKSVVADSAKFSLTELIQHAQDAIETPLSEEQRALYGISGTGSDTSQEDSR